MIIIYIFNDFNLVHLLKMGSCTSSPKTSKMQNVILPFRMNNHHNIQNHQKNSVDNNIDDKNYPKSNAKHKIGLESTVELTLYADTEEQLLPIYLNKDDQITISVQGQWSFYPEGDLCSITGHPNTIYNNYNIGQLLCRVQGGVCFPIANKKEIYKSDSNGQLLFYSNTDKCSVTPSGSLDITITGTTLLTNDQIDKESGWSSLYKPPKMGIYLTTDEYDLVNLINKIRINPHKFAKQYLDIINEPDASNYKETYNFLINYTPTPPLTISKVLYNAAKDHCKDIGTTGITGHISSKSNSTIKERIVKYSKSTSFQYFGENCSYGKKQPLSIALDMIIDVGLRNKYNQMNILNEKFNSIGVCILKHYSFKWVCVIVFAKDI